LYYFCTTCKTSYCGTLVPNYLFIYLFIKTHFGNTVSRGLAHILKIFDAFHMCEDVYHFFTHLYTQKFMC
jgi:hypothetical protein